MSALSRDRGGQLLQEARQRSNKQMHSLYRHRYGMIDILILSNLLILSKINVYWILSNVGGE